MNEREIDVLKVYPVGGINVIHVPGGRGDELRIHLESHGIHSKVSPATTTSYERLEVDGDVSAEDLQTIVDCWER